MLAPIHARHERLSWADLIVLAGTVAVETASNVTLPFCGGRTDADDGTGAESLSSLVNGSTLDTMEDVLETIAISGLTQREYVALVGGHSIGRMHPERSGYTGSWTTSGTVLSNEYYQNLLDETWVRLPCFVLDTG